MAIAQGAAGFHILSHSVYNYISGMSASDIIVCVDEVGNIEVQTFIRKVCMLFSGANDNPLIIKHIHLCFVITWYTCCTCIKLHIHVLICVDHEVYYCRRSASICH